MDETFGHSTRLRIDASQYASRGLVSCTRQGKIVWWGALPDVIQAPAFEILHCNHEDVPEALRVLSDGKRILRR